MAIALVQEITTKPHVANADQDTGAFGSNTGAGNFLAVVCWGWRGAAAFAMSSGAVSDNVNGSWGAAAVASPAQSNVTCHIFSKPNIAGGATTITVNPDSTANYFGWWAGEFSGMATVSPLDKTNSNSAGGNNPSGNAGATGVLTQADELILAVVSVVSDPTTIAVTGAFTEELEELDGASFQAGEADSLIVSATTSVTPTWNFSPNNAYTACVATFKAAAGGGGGPTQPPRSLHQFRQRRYRRERGLWLPEDCRRPLWVPRPAPLLLGKAA